MAQMNKCGACGAPNLISAARCYSCGAALNPYAPAQPTQVIKSSPALCQICGLKSSAYQCPICSRLVCPSCSASGRCSLCAQTPMSRGIGAPYSPVPVSMVEAPQACLIFAVGLFFGFLAALIGIIVWAFAPSQQAKEIGHTLMIAGLVGGALGLFIWLPICCLSTML